MLSWALGIAYAAADWLLLRLIMKRALQQPKRAGKMVTWGLAGRYLLTIAVLTFALLVPGLDPLGVVVPLIVQKAAAVVYSLLPDRKTRQKSGEEKGGAV